MVAFTVSFIFWAALHSVTAAAGPKAIIRRSMGERAYSGLYRLLYNLTAAVTLLPVLYLLATQVESAMLWKIPPPFRLVANLVQIVGLFGLAVTLWQRDILEFAGIRQAIDYLGIRNQPKSPPRLVTSGPHALVRHPLYFFGLLVLWFNPETTLNVLIFNVLTTIYFWIGSRYEERRLEAIFGEAYREYRLRVPGLLPLQLTARR